MTHGHRATAYPIHGAQINIWRQSTFFMGNLSVFRAGLKVKIRFCVKLALQNSDKKPL
jgi:hypothetical protein